MKSLLDLLPKGGGSIVDSLQNETKFLRRLLFLIQEGEEGISHFLKGELSHFDPHVGDTACHIRACYFSYLWISQKEVFPGLERDMFLLKTYAEKISVVIEQGARNFHRDLRSCFLGKFLNELNVTLDLGEVSLNLIASHLLSKYSWLDRKKMPQSINQNLLTEVMQESVAFCTALTRNLQRKLSVASVEFIISVSNFLSKKNVDFQSLPVLLPFLLKEDSCGRTQLPCIAVFELIANFMRCNPAMVCVWIVDFVESGSRGDFFFKTDEQGSWKSLSVDDLVEENPIFLIRACTSLKSKESFFSWCHRCGIHKILCWFGAVHPQYSGGFEFSFPQEYRIFFEESFNFAVSHKIGLIPKRDENLVIRHISVCEKKEVLRKIKTLPSLYESYEHDVLNIKSPLLDFGSSISCKVLS